MGIISLQVPQIGQPDTTEDVKVANNFTTLQTVINGNLDPVNLSATSAQSATVNQSGLTVKGASIIATSQSTGSTSYTTLATPDQVTSVVLANPGLIMVAYQATWQESVSGAARAAIFLGANQTVSAGTGSASPTVAETGLGGTANIATSLSTIVTGISSPNSGTGYTGDATTGQILAVRASGGGPCWIFATAGTYTVSVQFKASSGTVTALNRRLYVQAFSFA